MMVITVLDHRKSINESANKDFYTDLKFSKDGNRITITVDTYISDIPLYSTDVLTELIIDDSDKIKLLATETIELRIDHF